MLLLHSQHLCRAAGRLLPRSSGSSSCCLYILTVVNPSVRSSVGADDGTRSEDHTLWLSPPVFESLLGQSCTSYSFCRPSASCNSRTHCTVGTWQCEASSMKLSRDGCILLHRSTRRYDDTRRAGSHVAPLLRPSSVITMSSAPTATSTLLYDMHRNK